MRNALCIIVAILFSFSLVGQHEITVPSKITNATVYLEGARITRTSTIPLKKGKNTLLFSNLTGKLDPESIQLKAMGQLMIVSVSHSFDFLNQNRVSDSIMALKNDQQMIRDSVVELRGLESVLNEEKAMILSNKNIGGSEGFQIEDLEKAAEFFRSRLTEIERKQKKLNRKIRSLHQKQILISQQLLEFNSGANQPSSIIKAIVDCQREMNYDLELKYLVFNAGWVPFYDIRIDKVDQDMKLIYKAKVQQDSGEDWKEVNLVLSTANPQLSNDQPEMEPYFLTFNNYYKRQNTNDAIAIPQFGFVKGKVTDANTDEPLIGATVSTLDGQHGTVTDLNGFYQLSIPKNQDILEFSYIGFQSRQQRIHHAIMNLALQPATIINEISIVERSEMSIGTSATARLSGARVRKKNHIPLAIQKGQTSTEFVIDIPYSIPSDKHEYDVTMVEYEIEADYQYNCVPKLSEHAFLTAKISDWTQYHLQDGKIFLFLNGIYQGESQLDLKTIKDTLDISVGVDQDIAVERELITDFSDRNFFKNNIVESKAWKISIRNNKDSAIKLLLQDQVPVSKNKEIKVDIKEISNARLNEDNGTLKWALELQPGELKELLIKYEVKYPKNRQLILE